MQILMIPSFFKNRDNISSGSFFIDQAMLMQERGHRVSIIFADTYSLKYIRDFLIYKEHNEEINGVSVFRDRALTPLKHNGVLGNERSFVNCCLKIVKKLYKNENPFDIIHAQNCVWAGSAARVLSELYGIPYIVTEHSSMYELAEKRIISSIEKDIRLGLNNATGVICVSDKLKNAVKKYTTNEIAVIGNVVDTSSYSLINRSKKKNTTFVFTTVAFLTTEKRVKLKGIDLLVKGFKLFIKDNPNALLKIIGVPCGSSFLLKLISAADLKNNVILIEPLERKKIFEEYKNTNCFVLLGKYETFGLVYAEAMATGIPVIATDVGIATEIISDTTGVICKERTPKCVADALMRVYTKYDEYDPYEIRRTVTSKYSKEAVGYQIEKAYERAICNYANKRSETE